MVLVANGQKLAVIGVTYLPMKADLTVTTGGDYWSDLGSTPDTRAPSYTLCTGPAPWGYHLLPATVGIATASLKSDHGRSCGSYMECTQERIDDQDVCYIARPHGHWKAASFFGSWEDENEAIQVRMHLHATYVLNENNVSLRSLTK